MIQFPFTSAKLCVMQRDDDRSNTYNHQLDRMRFVGGSSLPFNGTDLCNIYQLVKWMQDYLLLNHSNYILNTMCLM